MAQPIFGIAGTDSLSDVASKDILELVDGINLQQFTRMARPSQSEQNTKIAAWGITPKDDKYWPESVTLTVAEEAVQHEEYNNVVPVAAGDGSVIFDASLVFRARVNFSVSGKCVDVADPKTEDWPDSFTSAIGGFVVGNALHPPTGTNPTIVTNAEFTKLRTDWHSFSYERQWIISGASTGANILDFTDFSLAARGAHKHVISRTYTLSNEGFATQNISVEYYPTS